ncbi:MULTISPECIES: hypothetical protein [Pseudomonas]|uniref:hypothetical protein n=1 Tax=Pseudomonas TaxID=286 RepID=UPI001F522FC3|nr:hypothetical protein [Pseudomonas putida]MCI0913983.1 hypothetical protein [Pseudomonas putida]
MSELATLHAAVTATIRELIPELAYVDAYTVVGNTPEQPALRHGIVRMTADAAPRDGRSVLIATFEADITADSTNPESRLQGSMLAAQLMDLLRQQHWALDFVEASRNAHAQFEGSAWTVRWDQPVLLGDPRWHWPDQPPGSLMLGLAPEVGQGNQDRYIAPEDLA